MANFAIFQTGGKQYRVQAGDTIKVEKINDSIADLISLIDVEEFACAYGPPSVIYKHRPIRRFINWIKYKIRVL